MSDLPAHFCRFVAPVRAKCRRLLYDAGAAEDATQETFARFVRTPPRLDPGDTRAVLAWLYRTCTRISIDMLRERRRRPHETLESGGGDAVPCGVDLAAALEARSELVKIVRDTPDDELAAAVLCRVDAMSQPEAAEVMNVSERTVRRLLDRFDDRLRRERT